MKKAPETRPRRHLVLALVLLALIGVVTLLTARGPSGWKFPTFLKQANLLDVLIAVSTNLTLGVGLTLVIIAAEIDLSVGRLTALTNVSFALALHVASQSGWGGAVWVVAVLVALGVGSLIGLANGVGTVLGRVPSFIVTLGTFMVAYGLAMVVTGGHTVRPEVIVSPRLMRTVPVLISLSVTLAAHLVLSRTVFGRHLYALGGSWEAARLSGVPVRPVKIAAFALSGLCAGLAGIIAWAQLEAGSPLVGEAYELYAIAAVIIGGTSLRGGEGSVIGTFLGALLMGVLKNGMDILGLALWWQRVVTGGVIVAAALLDSWGRRQGN